MAHLSESDPIETPAPPQLAASRVPLETESLGQDVQPKTTPAPSLPDILRAFAAATLVIWLLGIALLLARWCYGLHLIAVLRRTAQPLDGEAMAELLDHVRRALGTDELPPMADIGRLGSADHGRADPAAGDPAGKPVGGPARAGTGRHPGPRMRPCGLPAPGRRAFAAAGGNVVLAASAGASAEPGTGSGARGSLRQLRASPRQRAPLCADLAGIVSVACRRISESRSTRSVPLPLEAGRPCCRSFRPKEKDR